MKSNEIIFYVSLDGNDRWSGKLSSPNKNSTDGPFASITKAQDAIRKMKKEHGLKNPVTVMVRKGIYFLSETLAFTPQDSGTRNCPIIYTAFQNEKVILSGGRKVEKIKDGRKLWEIEISDAKKKKVSFRQIWVNGNRRFRAKYPFKEYFTIPIPKNYKPEKFSKSQNKFEFSPGDIKKWKNIEDMEVIVLHYWTDVHLPIKKVDEEKHTIFFKKPSRKKLVDGNLPARYYMENAFEFLKHPGQWYLDRKKGILHYFPLKGEKTEKCEIVYPVLSQILRLEGNLKDNKFAEHIYFKKLSFSHTNWELLENDAGDLQAAASVPGAVYGNGVKFCTFENCDFSHLGNYAIELSKGCKNNTISNCKMFDLGAGGIKIGEAKRKEDVEELKKNLLEQTTDNKIINCHIFNGGHIFHQAVGIWIGQSSHNLISKNHIHDFYYTGISIGWTWGYGTSLARNNIVEYNHIHHIGIRSNGDGPILSDMGGVYTLGIQPGTIIRNNIFHDIAGYSYGGGGIYLDEGSSYIIVENNLVYNTTHGGFHQHYGKENIIRNNIFAFGRDVQIKRSRSEPHISFTFERNIVYWNQGKLLEGNLDNLNILFDSNVYYKKEKGIRKFCEFNWKEWRKKGLDKNSLTADPLFVNPEKYNFQLKENSPALKMGFIQLLFSKLKF